MIELDKTKYDQSAHEVVRLAEEEAKRFSHDYVGTEHLLLGSARYEPSQQLLERLGLDHVKVQSAVEFIIGLGGDRQVSKGPTLTPRANRVLTLALDESRRRNKKLADSGDLLVGMVREGEGIAAGILESLGINLIRVRSVIYGNQAEEQSNKNLQDILLKAAYQEELDKAKSVLESETIPQFLKDNYLAGLRALNHLVEERTQQQ